MGSGGVGAGPIRHEAPCALYLVATGATRARLYDATTVAVQTDEKPARVCGVTDCQASFEIELGMGGSTAPDDIRSQLAETCVRLASGDIRTRPAF